MRVELLAEVFGLLERFDGVERVPRSVLVGALNGSLAGGHHESPFAHVSDARLVGFGPSASLLAAGDEKLGPRVIEETRLAVDPAEGERFFDHVVVGDVRASSFLEAHQPHAAIGVVIGLKPSR